MRRIRVRERKWEREVTSEKTGYTFYKAGYETWVITCDQWKWNFSEMVGLLNLDY